MTSVQPLPLPPSRWAVAVRWRNWRLPVKLAAVTAVPVLLAISLGALTVRNQVERSAMYERSDRFVVVGDRLLALTTALQDERDASARLLARPDAVDPDRLRQPRDAVDTAAGAVREAATDLVRPSESIRSRLVEVDRGLAALPKLRDRVTADLGLEPAAATGEYGAVIESLLDADRAIASDIADPELARSATALHDLAVTVDQLRLQSTLVSVGIVAGSMTAADLDALRASAARAVDKVDDFRAAAGATRYEDYQRTVAGVPVDVRAQLLGAVLTTRAGAPLPVQAVDWDTASGATVALTTDVTTRLGTSLREASAGLHARASNRAGAASVVLFAALLLAAAVGAAITRQLLGSLGVLRRTALQVADRELPAAVATIRDGGLPDTTVRPVPVLTTEDVGQLARAFDAVHLQALKLAADEAILRAGFGSVFVNLSRRSQGLVQRQLHLLERLERDEEDAEQLATLFQLDHLATRMRRNNENLMVLSGSDLARRPAEPAPLVDLLRAAVSEIEHYRRVELRPPPPAEVVGHASGDLVRLVAELLDNATAFSPPDTSVTVAAHRSDNGAVVVNVLDQGIGMSDEEITEFNARLRDTGPVDLPASRRMGLYVVGRLAMRHGFGVRLHGGKDLQGVQATVTVPAGLVVVPMPPPPVVPGAPGVFPMSSRAAAEAPTVLMEPVSLPEQPVAAEPAAAGHALDAGMADDVDLTPDAVGAVAASVDAASVDAGPAEPAWPEAVEDQPVPAASAAASDAVGPAEQAGAAGGSASGPPARVAVRAAAGELPVRRPAGGAARNGIASGGVRVGVPAGAPGVPGVPAGTRTGAGSPGSTMPGSGPGRPATATPPDGRPSWWDTGADPAARRPPPALPETTPIFDQMVSAWFQVPSRWPHADPDRTAPAADGRPVDAPTVNGHPADARTAPAHGAAGHGAGGRSAGDQGTAGRAAGTPGTESTESVAHQGIGPGPGNGHHAGVNGTATGNGSAAYGGNGRVDGPLDGWASAADSGWTAARAVSVAAPPSEFTPAGLPRRTPRQSLLPGSVATGEQPDPSPTGRDAEYVRSRLSSLRAGIDRGRHSLDPPPAATPSAERTST